MNSKFSDTLRQAGLRVTRPRISVLEEVSRKPHTSAETIKNGVTSKLGSVSTQAIYDVLHTLTAKGLLRKIEPAGSVPLYEIATHDNHHHLVCRNCFTVIDIPCVTGVPPCLEIPDPHGFLIDEAEVTFWGFCPRCLKNLHK
ncbi:Fur family transcriptional regulator [Arcanobacterium bovis]|uniref:Transcriptional repressor n=1 Tax=Arcanobacterium bovis TaxID=2529275 RepID=A0A4Q9V0S2_9ACTO|nr:Fur family transcriptional regulator [Arcanobacterium bovis]TBW21066.1 transcriptional repressor [Arcanobacterium bovis]